MDDLVKTLALIARIVIKEEHKVLDNKMTVDEKVEFCNAVSTLSEHSRHIQNSLV